MKTTMKKARKLFANRSIIMQRKGSEVVKVRKINNKGESFRHWAREEYKNNPSLSPKLLKIITQ